ncbi:MAG: hypothetical protein EXS15_03860 [Phycisphaerales bacterium]|nr:hypothetical protein [Phycisphaerales bacterium]
MSSFNRTGARATTTAPARTSIHDRFGFSWINVGWIPVICAALLTCIGIAAIATTEPGLAVRQLVYALVGVAAAALIVGPIPATVERWGPWIFTLTIGLLVVLVAPGVPEAIVRARNGSRCWIDFGPVDMQPAEFAKIAWIVAGAWWLRRTADVRSHLGLLLPIILTTVPVLLILMQPDLGTALLFFPTLLAMLLAQGARRWHLGTIVLSAVVLASASYPVLKPHQRARIDSLIAQLTGDDRYNSTSGFQARSARRLVGCGGVFGNGEEAARNLIRFNALPEEHNDMIFAVVACRWGLVGGIAVILLEAGVAAGAMCVAVAARSPFGRLLGSGVGAMLGFQSFVNVGMTMGVLPITGLTLPFVSFGGSSILASWIAVGLLFSVSARDARLGAMTGGSARRVLA